MACGDCVKAQIARAERELAERKAAEVKKVTRTPASRATYRKILEDAAKAKELVSESAEWAFRIADARRP